MWKDETAHFALLVKLNGHCGYWMVLTNKASAPHYGKHFKALSLWIAQFEASGRTAGQQTASH